MTAPILKPFANLINIEITLSWSVWETELNKPITLSLIIYEISYKNWD